MSDELKLFKTEHFAVPENEIKKKIRKFILGYKLLDSFLEMGTNPNETESLQLFSDLYNGMSPLLTDITCYVIINGYINKRKRVDNAILISQGILGLLKILHQRYVISITSPDPIEDPRWFQNSEKTNYEILEEISTLFEKMYSFQK